MSCYNPMVAIPTGEKTAKGKNVFRFSAMPKDGKNLPPGAVVVPCGRCIGCRADYARKWADRMMLELETCKKGVFVTLTYAGQVPLSIDPETGEVNGPAVCKEDCQLFMKRLRKYFDGVKVRFFLSAEYGPLRCRPHYHAILFGLSLDDFPDRVPAGLNDLGQQYYESEILGNIWSHGIVKLSEVSYDTCSYVARYVLKKAQDGSLSDYFHLVPEFSLMSRKPGIGKEYFEKHPDCLEFDSVNVSTDKGAKKVQLPRYYLKLLELHNPEKYGIIVKQRIEASNDSRYRVIHESPLLYLDYLEAQKKLRESAINSLRRDDK